MTAGSLLFLPELGAPARGVSSHSRILARRSAGLGAGRTSPKTKGKGSEQSPSHRPWQGVSHCPPGTCPAQSSFWTLTLSQGPGRGRSSWAPPSGQRSTFNHSRSPFEQGEREGRVVRWGGGGEVPITLPSDSFFLPPTHWLNAGPPFLRCQALQRSRKRTSTWSVSPVQVNTSLHPAPSCPRLGCPPAAPSIRLAPSSAPSCLSSPTNTYLPAGTHTDAHASTSGPG